MYIYVYIYIYIYVYIYTYILLYIYIYIYIYILYLNYTKLNFLVSNLVSFRVICLISVRFFRFAVLFFRLIFITFIIIGNSDF